jgi:hypothetical protein
VAALHGTMIARDVFLTASHCTAFAESFGARAEVSTP